MFVSGFMLFYFFWGGRGEARCFEEVEIVFEVDTPAPFQAFLEINWTNGELKGFLDHRPLCSCFTLHLRGTTTVCTKVNSYNFWYSARHVTANLSTTIFFIRGKRRFGLVFSQRLKLERYKILFVIEVVLIGVCNIRFPFSVVRYFPLNKPGLWKEFSKISETMEKFAARTPTSS